MDNVDLTDPIVSRFDVLCVVKDEANHILDGKLGTFVINSHIKSHPKYTSLMKLSDQEYDSLEIVLKDEAKKGRN